MKKIIFLSTVFFLIAQLNFSQNNYKRVSIPNITPSVLQQLDGEGIDLTCGAVIKDNILKLELNDHELNSLRNRGINYTVIIDDLTKFYSQRAVNDLPKARLELQHMKSQATFARSFSVSEVINNVGQHEDCDEIDWAVPTNWNLNPTASPNSFGGCLTYDMVLQELDDMRTAYPNLISVKADASPTTQTTIEGRTVYYVRISDNPDTDEAGEPETLYQSLIHSREAATVMNQLYFMWYLLENYGTDTAIKNLVNNQALYFIPVFNPDGFVHNQTVAPDGGGGQRKNRNISAGSCGSYTYGIDLNRNSAYYWGNGGSSTDPCNQTYMGTGPFSEPETQIMRDFFLGHDFHLALNHHSYKNAMLHAYAGTNITNPRPDEYSKYNYDMTYYNRYAHGPSTSISALNSGNMNDWMLGGPAGTSSNGTPTGTGSGKNTMAWTPENGLSSEGTGGSYGGFWPAPSNYVTIAKRAMRMNFLAAYYSGKYAKLHDLNQSDITSLSGNLNFAIENLGQTASDFTLTVTPVSANITSIGGPSTQTGMAVLQQNNVNISYILNAGIQANDQIEYKVVLTNDYASDNVLYEANIIKFYDPTTLFSDNPDSDNLTNWTASGGTWSTTVDAYSGTTAITSTVSAPYANNESKTLQLNSPISTSAIPMTIIQFYGKWDLERSFDYVQLEGSTDGSSWAPLCGKLTKPGAPNANNTYSGKSSTSNNFQPDGEHLYDGDAQDRWNMEEVVIDATNNSFLLNQATVYLRFDFRTESSNRQDSYYNANFEGFTFDDFKIITNATNIAQTITFNALADKFTSDVPFQVNATATSGLPVSYSIVSGPATISGNTVTLTGAAGTVTVRASQAGDATYNAAVDVDQAFDVSNTVTLHEGFFETGWDNWVDGGNDVSRYSGSRSFEGSYSIQLRDNSGSASAMTSQTFNLTPFADVEISFYCYANSMENGEDLWLRYFNGSSWITVAMYVSGTDFSNGSFFTKTVTLNELNYTFAANSQFRFQCDASQKNDQVYIDQVIITGTPSGPDVTPPSTPTNLISSNTTETTTDLTWNASTDNIGVTSYDLYQDGGLIGSSTGTSYQVTGLTGSTLYGFHVIAKDAAGNESAASNAANVTTLDPPDIEAPTAPTNLIASNTTYNSTDLSWIGSTDNVGVTGYDVYQNGGFITNVSGTTYGVTGLSPSTLYTFHIIARDAAGNSSVSSNVVNVTTDVFVDTEAPTNPSNLGASNTTETTTDLSWTASTDNIGVTDYDVYQDGIAVANVTGTTHQATGLTENTTYTFYVIANDAAGNSSGASNTINETTLTAPTCSDGIQNGDETGVDCGGSSCAPCTGPTILHQGFFETGWDGWTDGGRDASRYSGSNSFEGSYSIRLRDNSGTASSMTLSSLDLTSYNQIEVDFYFYANSMENGEDFWLRYDDGSGFVTVASYVSGADFNNNTFYNATVILESTQYNLAVNGQFRFQNDASAKNDYIYIDQVTITGLGATARGTSNSITPINTISTSTLEFTLYPNPVKEDILNIQLKGNAKMSFKILNMVGQAVMTGETTKEIKVGHLKSGMYFIEVNDGEKAMTKKFIKQ